MIPYILFAFAHQKSPICKALFLSAADVRFKRRT